jgi:undecaprenyl phosphate N,N'-diacetylbacillosamine 1-phosphate transferase
VGIEMQMKVKVRTKTPAKQNIKGGIYRRYFKRPMDFVLALCATIILSPVFLIVALLVKINLGSPVIFKQQRPGLNEKIFTLYKFRTMTDERDENGELLPDEIRLNKFGRFLRSTSLDELPELINVLKGDMSIVGPRPLLIRYLPYYTEEERQRHDVRPGLTGLAQVNGRNLLEWEKRLKADVKYTEDITFVQDVKIMVLTIKKTILRKDIAMGNQHILKSLDEERRMVKNGHI